MEQFSDKILKALGEWKVVRFLGSGQYGKVYEIQRTDFGTVYRAALKVISIPASEEEVREIKSTGMDDTEISNYFKSIVEDFVREFALMAKLKGHTNIVGYEDHQVLPAEHGVGWTILIRMELLTSLTDYVTGKQMTRRDVTKLGIDLCKALELCQRVNVIHRDIKPANIFVSEMGEYKLGDFGVARIVENTMSGRTGTDTYMAPEVYYEEKYGPSADIYSLGIVMYRLLNSNRAPFLPLPPQSVTYRDNAEAFRRRINGEELPLPSQADGRLAEIVMKACAYRTADRYSSPSSMRKELEEILYETDEAKVIYPNGDEVSAADGLSTNATVALRDVRKGTELKQRSDDTGEQTAQAEDKASEEIEFTQEKSKEIPDHAADNSGMDYHGDETICLLGKNRDQQENDSEEEPVIQNEDDSEDEPVIQQKADPEDKTVMQQEKSVNDTPEQERTIQVLSEEETGAGWNSIENTMPENKKKKTMGLWIGIAACICGVLLLWVAMKGSDPDEEIIAGTEQSEVYHEAESQRGLEEEIEEYRNVQEDEEVAQLSGTVKVAAVETAYGAQMWEEVAAAFEEVYPDVTVELTVDSQLDDVITPDMKEGKYPDVILKAVGSESALTETFIVDHNLVDLTDVLDMTVPGEHMTVGEKILPGFTDNMVTNPYGDGRTYLLPMFYYPMGLFYDANLLEAKGWDVPQTWDEMWKLGDKAAQEGISLFTYPTAGYFDAFFYSLLHEAMDTDTFNSALHYGEGVWDTDAAAQVFDIFEKLAEYTHESTPSQANDNDYMMNQQLVLDDQAIFMVNGGWVIGEMEDAPRAENFEWGFTALPAIEEGGERAAYSFFEQIWMPVGSENQDLGKAFLAFLYSDAAADIFAASGAIQPIPGMSDRLEGDQGLFYSIYDTGAVAVVDVFANAYQYDGITIWDTFFDPMNDLVTGDLTKDEWIKRIKENNDIFREGLGE